MSGCKMFLITSIYEISEVGNFPRESKVMGRSCDLDNDAIIVGNNE
jgi:hypothetical protein